MAKKEFTRTISNALFYEWNELRRRGDNNAIQAFINSKAKSKEETYSKPVILRALKYGFIGYSGERLQELITEFYAIRRAQEEKNADKLRKS